MNKKDYVLIADAIVTSIKFLPEDAILYNATIIKYLCVALQKDNPNFNPDTFKEYIVRRVTNAAKCI